MYLKWGDLVKILSICDQNVETYPFKGCTCIECKQKPAEIAIFFSPRSTQQVTTLCLECTWNLMDWLQETTASDFVKFER